MLLKPFLDGVNQYFEPYNIKDTEFANLVNAIPRRGSVVKRLGDEILGILQTQFSGSIGVISSGGTFAFTLTPIANGIEPGSVTVTVGAQTYTDNDQGGISTIGTINYVTGALSLSGLTPTDPVSITYSYYPGNPVMGIGTLQSLETNIVAYLVVMDTTSAYSFNYSTRTFFNISTYTSSDNTVTWNGTDYQQFSFANFQDALFLTNGNPGMHYAPITSLTAASTLVTVGVTNHKLIVNDQVFFYEVQGMTQINGLVGTVTTIINPNSFQALVPDLVTPSPYTSGGIIQYLTSNVADPTVDGIRVFTQPGGFMNFAPPLSPSNLPGGIVYYLVGCNQLIEFGNRLLALGCYTQTSTGALTYTPNLICFSFISSALYTLDFSAWWQVPVGYGGFIELGGNQPIIFASLTAETLVVGLSNSYRKLIPTGNKLVPFVDYSISTEYGASCPFSNLVLDNRVVGIASNGIIAANPNTAARVDNANIPDAVANISGSNFGFLRVSAGRDYLQQLLFFNYPQENTIFPSASIVYNLIEQNWSFAIESYTCFGQYTEQGSSRTWDTVGTWDDAGTWGQGDGTQFTQLLAAGTPWGAVITKGQATYNEPCMPITAMSGNTITVPNNNVLAGYFLYIEGCLGNSILNFTNVEILAVSGDVLTISTDVGSDVYVGGGLAAVVDNFAIVSKAFAPNWDKGLGVQWFDFRVLLSTTTEGQISAYITPNLIPASPYLNPSEISGASVINTSADFDLGLNGTQEQQTSIWHRLPILAANETLQIVFFLSKTQMLNTTYTQSPVSLNAILINMSEDGKFVA